MEYRRIDNPKDGETVQFLGVYALRWRPEWGDPTVAFIEIENNNQKQAVVEEEKHCDTCDWLTEESCFYGKTPCIKAIYPQTAKRFGCNFHQRKK